MSEIYFNGDINRIKYSGFTITKIYACGGQIVYEKEVVPDKLMLTYNDSTTYSLECESSSSTITKGDVSGGTLTKNRVVSANIGDCVTTIGDYAFDKCYEMSSVTMPNSVTTIGNYGFSYCAFPSIVIPSGVTSIGTAAFFACGSLKDITLPSGITVINDSTFDSCRKLSAITIPNSVTSIGHDVFNHCSGLTEVTIPNSVTTIGEAAFTYCVSLSSVTIGSGVTTIENNAFHYCSGLTEVTIPSGVTSIGSNAFDYCTSLTSITVEATTPPYLDSESAFNYSTCPIYVPCESVNAYKTAMRWRNIADRITCIQPLNNKLTLTYNDSTTYSLECESSSSTITKGDVSGGTRPTENIVSAEIGDCVTTIGAGIFTFCTTLTSVTIGSGVTSIGISAFYGCTSLTSVTVNAITPPSLLLGDEFTNTNNCPIYVPAESVDAYKASSKWSIYASRIQAIPSS